MRRSVRELSYMNLRISRFPPSSIVSLQQARIVQRLPYEPCMLLRYRSRDPLCISSGMPVFNHFALVSSVCKLLHAKVSLMQASSNSRKSTSTVHALPNMCRTFSFHMKWNMVCLHNSFKYTWVNTNTPRNDVPLIRKGADLCRR